MNENEEIKSFSLKERQQNPPVHHCTVSISRTHEEFSQEKGKKENLKFLRNKYINKQTEQRQHPNILGNTNPQCILSEITSFTMKLNQNKTHTKKTKKREKCFQSTPDATKQNALTMKPKEKVPITASEIVTEES